MTTTLRPTEPLQRAADGTRSRRYQVCVNSRPVGVLRLGTSAAFGDAVAVVRDLRVDEGDRRRGRATVAALAAEEVARGWGCRQISTTVPADAEAALRLVEVLGYVPVNRGMRKRLGDTPPPLPAGSRARPMTRDEFDVWEPRAREEYARTWAERGIPADVARAKARRDHEILLPRGLDTESTLISVVEHDGERVGLLWLALREDEAFVFDVEVEADHRGRGHGRTLMRLAESQAVAAGRRLIGLNVFAGNTPAERLYASLGYRTTRHGFHKALL
ncbi:GNAT family N-acetyltransferase [Streptomyces sp. CRN 30]|uniref:GNAT family N-acetyltransferase n=1 Tax=Streptomyces sp. CRN 30 TaxID=3075613 RepID=UPI002A8354EB|nr:GNAT family N-acetyltransferase [Streptomyces sp. CRN 30]